MEQPKDDLTPRKLVVNNLEKQITPAMVEIFLKTTKALDAVTSYRKDKDKVYLEFRSEDDGRQFLQEHNQRSQIMARRFNIYWACFQKEIQTYRFEVNGVTEAKLRNLYDCCKLFGPCKFNLKYQGQKLAYNCIIEFLNQLPSKSFQQLKTSLSDLELNIRPEQQFGDFDRFRCSIELSHFCNIIDLHLSEQEELKVTAALQGMVKEITEQQISGVQLHTFEHQKQPTVKAYFKFKDNETTFNEFERLRKLLLAKPDLVRCRLFYFQDEANTYRTLFVWNILNTKQLPEKQLEDELITAFRNINPNVVQVLLRGRNNVYTGKIYLRQELNGREFLADYPINRKHIYQFFQQKRPIKIDVFQCNKEQKKQIRLQNNADKMINHLQSQKKKLQQGAPPFQPFVPPSFPNYQAPPPFYPPYHQNQYQAQPYNKPRPNNTQNPKKASRYRPKEDKDPKNQENGNKNVKLTEDDFPSMK